MKTRSVIGAIWNGLRFLILNRFVLPVYIGERLFRYDLLNLVVIVYVIQTQ